MNKLAVYVKPEVKSALESLAKNVGKDVKGYNVMNHPNFLLIVHALRDGVEPSQILEMIDTSKVGLKLRTIEAFEKNLLPYVSEILDSEDLVTDRLSEVVGRDYEGLFHFYVNQIRDLRSKVSKYETISENLTNMKKVNEDGVEIPGSTQFNPQIANYVMSLRKLERQYVRELSELCGGQDVLDAFVAITTKVLEIIMSKSYSSLEEQIPPDHFRLLVKEFQGNMTTAISDVLSPGGLLQPLPPG